MSTAPSPDRRGMSPAAFLMCMTFINWLGFAGWMALLQNFTIERVGFGWFETGLTQTVREIPGFLGFTAILWFLWFREQTVAYASLLLLAAGIAVTGFYPTLTGVLLTTFLMSIGFHYFETVNQSLQLQLLSKTEAPYVMGRITAVSSAAQFLAYGGLAIAWWAGATSYVLLYGVIGCLCLTMTIGAIALFPRFTGPVIQNKGFVIRQRYWLYYLLVFIGGARRQIFIAFAGFLLVKSFGFTLAEMAILMLATAALTMLAAPGIGALVASIGERNTMLLEGMILVVVFAGYALTSDGRVAAVLFVIDGIFFTLAIAQRTYFQKIADPADMASTSSVAFTINHIAAVIIPIIFGLLGMGNPALIFWLGVVIATISLGFAFLVPLHPTAGRESVFARAAPQAAE